MLQWAREQIDRGLQQLAPAREGRDPSEPRSIAEVLARIARVRFAADDPTQREAALDVARELNQAGFGELLAGAANETERKRWNIGRLRRVRATQYRHWVAAAACLLLAVLSVVFSKSQALRARLDPPKPEFKLTWPGAANSTVSIVGEPRLFACDANSAGSTLRRLGERSRAPERGQVAAESGPGRALRSRFPHS